MKKYIILFFLLIAPLGCEKNEDTAGPSTITESKVNVKVDARMELLAVIQHFTPWAGTMHTKYSFSYKNDIENYFKAYSGHPAVVKSNQLTQSGFAYDAPPTFVLYHNDPPDFNQIVPYSGYLIGRAGGESVLEDFAGKIRSFAVDSKFMGFYTSNMNVYDGIEAEIKNTIGNYDYVQVLEDYYGEKKHSYTIIPVPLFHAGGYGPRIESSGGEDVYSICGPMSVHNGKPYFGDQDYFSYILLHEFSHSFVNPITTKYSSEIASSSSLFEPIKEKMVQQAYNNWQICVNEHLVRVNVARFALAEGKIFHDQIIQSEMNNGFVYITDLDTLMDRYEKNRGTYKTYESFYPEIIRLFNLLRER
jgi:hypothetical protein